MLQELINSTESAGNASWTDGKMLGVVGGLTMVGLGFTILLAVLIPGAFKTVIFAALGIGGSILSLIAVFVLLYNFNKILKQEGFR